MYQNVTIVIPSYKPDEKLISTVRGIREAGFCDLIVVDDGGGEKYAEYFKRVRDEFDCTVLTHEINRGKGAALKTAFKYYKENRPNSIGLVTADADGQHLPKDIAATAETMEKTHSVVLGSRDFTEPHVPPRSKFGNNLTSSVFKIFFGMKIGDTQTGLRGIPTEYVSVLAGADGDRYEYETHMLFLMKQKNIPFTEVKISTVYLDENSSSHFRVIRDSMRIYDRLIRFGVSSIIATVVDIVLFCVLFGLLCGIASPIFRIASAALLARAVSAVINYTLNATAVFRGKGGVKSFGKYILLAMPKALLSATVAVLFSGVLEFSIPLMLVIRALIEFLLFTLSFRVQHNKIFR